jgi:hypothetical protein
MLPFGVIIPATVPQGSEILEGLMNNSVYIYIYIYLSFLIDPLLLLLLLLLFIHSFIHLNRDSSVGIVTRYGMYGPGIKSRWELRFSAPFWVALGPTKPPIKWVPGLSRGVKRPGRCVDHPPHLVPRFKERVVLYLNSPSGPSWPVQRCTLLLLLPLL